MRQYISVFLTYCFFVVAAQAQTYTYQGVVDDDIPTVLTIERNGEQYNANLRFVGGGDSMDFLCEYQQSSSGKMAYYVHNSDYSLWMNIYDVSEEYGKPEGSIFLGYTWDDAQQKTMDIVFFRN